MHTTAHHTHNPIRTAIIGHNGPVFASMSTLETLVNTIRAREKRQQTNEGHSISIFDPGEQLKNHALSNPTIEAAQDHVRIWTPIREATTWARARFVAEAMLNATSGADLSDSKDASGFLTEHSTNIVAALLLIARTQPGSSLETIRKRAYVLFAVPDGVDEVRGRTFNKASWQEFVQDLQDIEDKYSKQAEEGMARAARSARMAVLRSMTAIHDGDARAGICGAISELTFEWAMSPAAFKQPWDAPDTLDLESLAEDHTVYMTCRKNMMWHPLAYASVSTYMLDLQMRADRAGGKLKSRHLVVLDELAYCTPHSKLLSWANNLASSAGFKLLFGAEGLFSFVSTYPILWPTVGGSLTEKVDTKDEAVATA